MHTPALLSTALLVGLASAAPAHAASSQQPRSATAAASDTWSPTQTYSAGCVVIFQGRYFKAKWWADAGQSPAQIDPTQPWLSPWEEGAETTPGCDGGGGAMRVSRRLRSAPPSGGCRRGKKSLKPRPAVMAVVVLRLTPIRIRTHWNRCRFR